MFTRLTLDDTPSPLLTATHSTGVQLKGKHLMQQDLYLAQKQVMMVLKGNCINNQSCKCKGFIQVVKK